MDAYHSFAEVYDTYMDNVPYEQWCGHIVEILKEANIEDGLVAELGCGTGKMTRLLQKQGYDMIGIDNSYDMLGIALGQNTDGDILYLCQDMREFELYGTVGAIVSVCDSMNYITTEEDLLQVFRLVNNYLDPGGIFVFDMNTLYKYRTQLGENTFAENREMGSFIWENYFDEDSGINEYDLTLYIKEEDSYTRYYEEHFQKAYEIDDVTQLLQEAGMQLKAVIDADTMKLSTDTSERVYYIATECMKESLKS